MNNQPENSNLIDRKPWGLQWALLFQLLFMAVGMTPNVINLFFPLGQAEPFFLIIAVPLAMVGFTLFAVKRFKNLTWGESLRFLGFKRPGLGSIAIGLLSLIPTLLFYFYAYRTGLVTFKDFSTANTVGILLGAGLLEETFYRGFMFRMLRRGRSFIWAAILSGLFWTLAHAVNQPTIPGLDPHFMLRQMATVFLQSIPLALLFEWGGNVIWAPMLSHAGYDLIGDMFGINPEHHFTCNLFAARLFSYGSLIAAGLLIWGLAVRFLARSRADVTPEGDAPIRENRVSAQWAPWMLIIVLAVAGVLAYGAGTQNSTEKNEIGECQRTVEAFPDDPIAHLKLGLILAKYRLDDQAEAEYQKTLQLDPNNYMAYVSWGESLSDWTEYERAIPLFQKALEINPDYGDAYFDWGIALARLGKNDQALPLLEKAIRLDSKNSYVVQTANDEIAKIKGKLP